MSVSNISLCTIFIIFPILYNYCICRIIIYGYIFMYRTIYLFYVLCIVYYSFVPDIIINI
jgi:hypothetical protein